MSASSQVCKTVDEAPVRDVLDIDESATWSSSFRHKQATRAAVARNKSVRRRFVDPTTCERDYSRAELEFMMAMNEYKKRSGRNFPTWSEVLEVLRALGYEKVAAPATKL
jgi:hypothetical protein